jgi:hypothetical protein
MSGTRSTTQFALQPLQKMHNVQEEIAMAAPSFSYTIKVSQLDGTTRLPDGDVISIVEESGDRRPGSVTLTLEEAKGKWWKGIVFFEARDVNDWTEIAAGNGDELNDPKYGKRVGSTSHSTLDSGFLALSKAKAFGTHSNVYLLQDAAQALESGKHYKVTWSVD